MVSKKGNLENDSKDQGTSDAAAQASTNHLHPPAGGDTTVNLDSAVEALETELERTRTELEESILEQEAANEELKSSNAELLSINEELQSAIEELRTSKQEISAGMEALSRARRDLKNLLDGTRVATIYLDREGEIKSFTPSATEIYNLKEVDIGRPLSEITNNFNQMPPIPSIQTMQEQGGDSVDDIQTNSGRWFQRRVLSYLDNGQLDGLILTFVDISQQKRAAMAHAAAFGISQLLTSGESFSEIMPGILETVRDQLEADVCSLWMMDGESQQLYCAQTAFDECETQQEPFVAQSHELRLDLGQGIPGKAWESKQPLWFENVGEDPNFLRAEMAAQAGLVDGMALPVMAGKRVRCVIEFYTSRPLHREQPLLDMLRDVGHEIGQFIRRTRLDERFREEEARKTAILDSALDCIITMDTSGRIVDFNHAAERTFGIQKSQAIARQLADVIIPKEFREKFRLGMSHFLKTGESKMIGKRTESVALRSNGEKFPIEMAINVTKINQRAPFFTAYLRDITARKRRESNLAFFAELETELGSLTTVEEIMASATKRITDYLNLSRCLLLEFDDQALMAEVIGEYCATDRPSLLGVYRLSDFFSPDERLRLLQGESIVVNDTQADSLPPETASAFAALNVGAVVDVPYLTGQRLKFMLAPIKETSYTWKLHEIKLLSDLADRIYLRIERARAVRRLERRAQLEHFVSQASEVMYSSLDYEVTLAKVTQLTVPTLADWAFLDLIGPHGEPTRIKVVHVDPAQHELAAQVAQFPAKPNVPDHPPARALYAGQAFLIENFTEEMLVRAAQNDEHEAVMRAVGPKSFICVPLVARERTLGALTLIRTQTRTPFDKDDFQVAQDLCRRASIAVDNAQLFDAGQKANVSKTEFLANMSHEIRTPMSAIIGYADILGNHLTDPDDLNCVQIIRNNGNFLLEIINDILDISKIEAGKLELTEKPFRIDRLAADLLSLMNVRASEKMIDFSVEFKGEVPRKISSDQKRLKQILVNLIGNAIKFTQQGSVGVVISCLPADPADRSSQLGPDDALVRLRFDVIDTGIGVTIQQQEKLFQPFTQADASVGRKFGGTGLGLAISQRLAQMLGGDISIDSQPGTGSTFSLTMTAKVSDSKSVDLQQWTQTPSALFDSTPPPPRQQPSRIQGRILVVDDRREIRFIAQHFIQDAGGIVETGENGLHAIEKIEAANSNGQPFDLLVIDMQMPVMDGYEAARRLRSLGFDRPIIALTAHAMEGDRKQCLAAGCTDYVAKPLDGPRFIELVARYLNSH